MRVAAALVLCLLLSSCYRTHYANFSPENPNRAASAAPEKPVLWGWQHFILWGFVASETTIDARKLCGRSENIHSIQTRRTFLEGLVAAVPGIYLVFYSPWNGQVYCGEPPR